MSRVPCLLSRVSCLVSHVFCFLGHLAAPGGIWQLLEHLVAPGGSWGLLAGPGGFWWLFCVCVCVCGGGGGRILEKWVLRCMVSFLKHPVRFPQPVSAHRTRPRPPDTALCVSGARAWYCVRFPAGETGTGYVLILRAVCNLV